MSEQQPAAPGSGQFSVYVYKYDLSQGMARMMSRQFLGKQIDGIWHTGIVVYGKEYYFGQGVSYSHTPGGTVYGTPVERIFMGNTAIPEETFNEFLQNMRHRFNEYSYDLLSNNCNNFTQEACRFLVEKDIPAHITGLPAEVLSTPLGAMLRPMIESFSNPAASGHFGAGGLPFGGGGGASAMPSAQAAFQPAARAPVVSQPSVMARTGPQPIIYSTGNLDVVTAKLRAFIDEAGLAADVSGDAAQFCARVTDAIRNNRPLTDADAESLADLLEKLPADKAFPALDLQRLAFIMPSAVDAFLTSKTTVLEHLLDRFADAPAPFRIMTLRMFCNMFTSEAGANYVRVRERERFLAVALDGVRRSDAERKMGASLLHNMFAGAEFTGGDDEIEAIGALTHSLTEADLTADTAEKVLEACLVFLRSPVDMHRELFGASDVDFDRLEKLDKATPKLRSLLTSARDPAAATAAST